MSTSSAIAGKNYNPYWLQVFAICPLILASSTFVNGLSLALASFFTLGSSSLIMSLLRPHLPESSSSPCFTLILATFTSIAVIITQVLAFEIHFELIVFIQILMINSIIFNRIDDYSYRNSSIQNPLSFLRPLIVFSISLVLVGGLKEFFGAGSLLSNITLLFPEMVDLEYDDLHRGISILATPAGTFILIGMLLGLSRLIMKKSWVGQT